MLAAAVVLALAGAGASAQTIHPGEVGRWFLVLAPMQQARGCLPEGDPLRPGLEALLRDTHSQATRAIASEYERGLLAGRLMEQAQAVPESPNEERCRAILAELARGLLRLHVP
ncbi:MAG TPA: hypothetical protein VGN83_02195 [Falsiroseomonas sp.]|nr:hypothetical protein [Falsiroseomonas sp.]